MGPQSELSIGSARRQQINESNIHVLLVVPNLLHMRMQQAGPEARKKGPRMAITCNRLLCLRWQLKDLFAIQNLLFGVPDEGVCEGVVEAIRATAGEALEVCPDVRLEIWKVRERHHVKRLELAHQILDACVDWGPRHTPPVAGAQHGFIRQIWV